MKKTNRGNLPALIFLFVLLLLWQLGAMKVGWTSHEPRNEKGRDAVIFEFYKPEVSFK